jgi:hypothetical protein
MRASLSAVSAAVRVDQQTATGAAPAPRMTTRRLLAINSLWLGQGAHWPPC